jgi:hypothetical protein
MVQGYQALRHEDVTHITKRRFLPARISAARGRGSAATALGARAKNFPALLRTRPGGLFSARKNALVGVLADERPRHSDRHHRNALFFAGIRATAEDPGGRPGYPPRLCVKADIQARQPCAPQPTSTRVPLTCRRPARSIEAVYRRPRTTVQDQAGHEIVERNCDLVLRWPQIACKGLPNWRFTGRNSRK